MKVRGVVSRIEYLGEGLSMYVFFSKSGSSFDTGIGELVGIVDMPTDNRIKVGNTVEFEAVVIS